MFKKLLNKKSSGFTLIEIVLVLAIAGLILVIVFLAVNGAQKSRRDTARKDYVNRVVAAYTSLVADGIATPNNAQMSAAIPGGAGGDRPTLNGGTIAGAPVLGTCPTASITQPNVDVAGNTVCITLEDGASYSQSLRQ